VSLSITLICAPRTIYVQAPGGFPLFSDSHHHAVNSFDDWASSFLPKKQQRHDLIGTIRINLLDALFMKPQNGMTVDATAPNSTEITQLFNIYMQVSLNY